MNLFEHLSRYGYGEIHVKRDDSTGLSAIVAIHDTRLGPSLGGCRFISYPHEELALIDALRLARGMTYKAAISGLPHGGGKAVILRPRVAFDREALFESFARFLDALGGRYITAEDSGTSPADMETMRPITKYVTGGRREVGGGGDPSPWTALGVRRGIEAAVGIALGRRDLGGLHVAVQGVGAVGYWLCRELHERGARLTITDVDPARIAKVQAEMPVSVVGQEEIFAVECDVLAPCALGSAIDDATLPRLGCKVVAGAANNQLAEPRHGRDLLERGIVYAPDYAINAGGLINVAQDYAGYDEAKVRAKVEAIHDTVLYVLERAQRERRPPHEIADSLVEERLNAKARTRA